MTHKNYKILFATMLSGLLVSSTNLMAVTSYEVEDGATAQIQGSATSYTNLTITSTTETDASTAILETIADVTNKTVTLTDGCTLTGYYGQIKVSNGDTLDIQRSTSSITIPADLYVAGSAAATTLKLTSTSAGILTFSGSSTTDSYGAKLDTHGILDLSGSTNDITFSNPIYLNGYEANAPYIKYVPSGDISTTLHKLIVANATGKGILSSDATANDIYASKNFTIDLTSASATTVSATAYPVVQSTTSTTPPTLAAADLVPTVTGNSDGSWTVGNMTVTNPSGNTRNVNMVLTYNPPFALDTTVSATTPLARTVASLITAATEGVSDNADTLQTLRKDLTTGTAATVSKSISFDLGAKTLGGASQTWAIAAGKTLALKASTGKFDGQVTFGDTTSAITVLGTGLTNAIFGTNFSGSGATSGIFVVGDGTTAAGYTHSLADTKVTTANKFSKIVVKGESTLKITH